jgi:hypothetical protein
MGVGKAAHVALAHCQAVVIGRGCLKRHLLVGACVCPACTPVVRASSAIGALINDGWLQPSGYSMARRTPPKPMLGTVQGRVATEPRIPRSIKCLERHQTQAARGAGR